MNSTSLKFDNEHASLPVEINSEGGVKAGLPAGIDLLVSILNLTHNQLEMVCQCQFRTEIPIRESTAHQ
jgi:primosomal replication protein N